MSPLVGIGANRRSRVLATTVLIALASIPPSASARGRVLAPPSAAPTAEASEEPETPTPTSPVALEPDTSPSPPADPDPPAASDPPRADPRPAVSAPLVEPHEHPHEHADRHEHPHEHADPHEHPHEHTAAGTSPIVNTRVPARMSAIQQGGWWSLLGAFVLTGTTATLGGVAAREQGRRRELALQADPPAAGPVRESAAQVRAEMEIERSRRRGRAYSQSAIVVGSVAGAAALAGVILLVVDAARRRTSSNRRASVGSSGIEVRF